MKASTLLALLGSLLAALPARGAAPPVAGADFQVNVVAEGTQELPAVAQDTAGDSVVVWLDEKGSPALVKARLFDAAGAPAGGEIAVASLTPPLAYAPRVAMTPLGAFAVVWLDQQGAFLRRYDRLGRPDGDAVHLQLAADDVTISSPSVALDAGGNAFVAWAVAGPRGGVIVLQRLDAANHPLGPAEVVNQSANGLRGLARVAVGPQAPAAPSDNVLVSWDDERSGQPEVWARRFDGASGAWAPEARVSAGPTALRSGGRPLLDAHGAGAVVFTDLVTHTVRLRRLDAAGVPFPADLALSLAADPPAGEPSAAATPDGTALVAWPGLDGILHAAFFDGAWQRQGTELTVGSFSYDAQSQPAVAAGGAGSLLVAWAEGGPIIIFDQPVIGRDGSGLGIFAQRFQAPACAAGSDHLCLGPPLAPGASPLFDVQVSWRNPYTGETGTGRSRPLTGDTGAFWFFDPANLELMIKILDGRAVNGYFWVFYGSLSNVEYTITVREILTGAVKTYHNAPLHFASQADVQAFLLVSAAPPASAATPATSAPRLAAPPAAPAAAPFAAGDCAPTPTTLCPQNRFRAAVSFTDPRTGAAGPGAAVTLTDDTGIFWFFDPTNLELMVKVLDGSAINGHFWVFYGGLSDVDYTLTVTDTATGAQRTYHNPRHHLASAADLAAF